MQKSLFDLEGFSNSGVLSKIKNTSVGVKEKSGIARQKDYAMSEGNKLFDIDSPGKINKIQTEKLDVFGAELGLVRRWLSLEQSGALYSELNSLCQWQQPSIFVAGRAHSIPRLQAWYGDQAFALTYSGTRFLASPMPKPIQSIRDKIQKDFNCVLNSVLVNCYRDENDSMGWHADDESEFGVEPFIVSLSLGETRRFGLKPKSRALKSINVGKVRRRAHYLSLESGDVLVMRGLTQERCVHNIPKETKPFLPRLNLTFRKIID